MYILHLLFLKIQIAQAFTQQSIAKKMDSLNNKRAHSTAWGLGNKQMNKLQQQQTKKL